MEKGIVDHHRPSFEPCATRHQGFLVMKKKYPRDSEISEQLSSH